MKMIKLMKIAHVLNYFHFLHILIFLNIFTHLNICMFEIILLKKKQPRSTRIYIDIFGLSCFISNLTLQKKTLISNAIFLPIDINLFSNCFYLALK